MPRRPLPPLLDQMPSQNSRSSGDRLATHSRFEGLPSPCLCLTAAGAGGPAVAAVQSSYWDNSGWLPWLIFAGAPEFWQTHTGVHQVGQKACQSQCQVPRCSRGVIIPSRSPNDVCNRIAAWPLDIEKGGGAQRKKMQAQHKNCRPVRDPAGPAFA